MINSIRSFALALLLAAGYAAPANAIQPVLTPDVTITEYFDSSTYQGSFEVSNSINSGNTLHYFAVANNSIDSVWAYNEWLPAIITRTDWENNAFGFDMSYQVNTSNYDWVAYFGATATQVAVYASNVGFAPGESGTQFGFSSAVPASPFLALGENGAVMASGATAEILAVPEASSAAMFGVGVLMLVWAVGRRRKGARVLLAA